MPQQTYKKCSLITNIINFGSLASATQMQAIETLYFHATLHFVMAKDRVNEPVIAAFLKQIKTLWYTDLYCTKTKVAYNE
ncbi:MAG: hypothetical protein ACJAVV_000628 [Alphaproteobacteria bacterium]|jgi:hypothetical protein